MSDDMVQSSIKGRTAGAGTGAPVDLTVAQVQAILGLVGTTTDNAVIRADGVIGGTQSSGVLIDDSDNITGVERAFLGTIGATFKGHILAGVQDGTAAVAGQVGERTSSSVTAVAAGATGVAKSITSISLRGDYDISGAVVIDAGATGLTSGSTVKCSIVTTTNTNGVSASTMVQQSVLALLVNGIFTLSIPKVPVNVGASTTYFITVECTYAAGSPTVDATIIATRQR
jgi:hypothetical protein